jgi:hypothetical protein
MLRMKSLMWWVAAAVVAVVALTASGVHMGARAAKKSPATAACRARELAVDLDGDGRAETVRLVRVGDDAWADVWSGALMRSSTRVGAWREDAALEALDVNADGKVDLVRRWSEGHEEHAQVWLSDGRAFDEGWSGITGHTCVAQR